MDANVTRRRRRAELRYLRERTAELELELARLQALRSGDGGVSLASEAEEDAAESTSVTPWERIAGRQRAARRNAEEENERLRAELEAQLRIARSLERLLRKRPGIAVRWWGVGGAMRKAEADLALWRWTLQEVDARELKRGRLAVVQDEDTRVYGLLMERIDGGYARYENLLREVGLTEAPPGHRETKLVAMDEDGVAHLVVQLIDATIMPFPVEATASASWRCITSGYMQVQHEVYQGLAHLPEVLALQYSITMTRRRLHVDVTARAAMRKFSMENGDVLFVWESQAVPSECDDASGQTASQSRSKTAVHVRERGWTLFSRASSPDSTRVLTCMQMLPLVASDCGDPHQSRQVGVLTDLALEYFDQQIDHAHHAVETLLLDEAMGTL